MQKKQFSSSSDHIWSCIPIQHTDIQLVLFDLERPSIDKQGLMSHLVASDLLTQLLHPNNGQQHKRNKAERHEIGHHVEVLCAIQGDIQEIDPRHISQHQISASQKVEGGQTEGCQISAFVDEPKGGYHDDEIKGPDHIKHNDGQCVGRNGEQHGTAQDPGRHS